MSEILKEAFAKPRAINQNKYSAILNKAKWPKYIWDYYPLALDYYHEFNPYFVHLLENDRIFPEFKVFTVRDGVFPFADFIIKNIREIPNWKTVFLIPAEYAPLVPAAMKDQFFTYSFSQIKKPDITKAKTVTIFSLLCDQYFGSMEKIEEKLSVLKDLPSDAKLEICLGPRRNPFSLEEKESLDFVTIPEHIRKLAGKREVHWIKMRDLLEKSVLRNDYFIDLMDGKIMTCDSFLPYWFMSRGGMVHNVPVWDGKESLFDIDLSFYHKLHVNPLPDVKSNISEVLFFTKTTKSDYLMSARFQEVVLKAIST
jgi:hypothetical protein